MFMIAALVASSEKRGGRALGRGSGECVRQYLQYRNSFRKRSVADLPKENMKRRKEHGDSKC